MRFTVLALVAAAASGARLHRLPRLLRLRGGEDAATDGGGGLTFQEVTDKLNRVPCFCVLRADGSLAPISADDGTAVHTWYLDPRRREALELMAAAADELDGEELSLGVTAMGTVSRWPAAGRHAGRGGRGGAAPDPSALRPLGLRASREPLEAQLRAAASSRQRRRLHRDPRRRAARRRHADAALLLRRTRGGGSA